MLNLNKLKWIVGTPCAAVIFLNPANQATEALYWHGYTKVAGIELRYEKALAEAEEVIAKAEAEPEYREQNKGVIVAAQAMTWKGAYYKKGTPAMCASFVRSVLALEGITIPTAQGSLGPLMADSLHAPEQGTIILDPKYLRPGDLVMFSNTYNGGGRILNGGRITHVGIIVSDCSTGECMMIDRPTKNGAVQYRPISTFRFNSAMRPHVYNR